MRIVNFNRRIKTEGTWLNTYIDWNKTYCQDLNNKITSLYDYVQWNYPEFLVLNSPTSLSDKNDFNALLSLSDPTIEPRLVTVYEKEVEMFIDEENNSETRSIFFPSRLNYHQGFYNTSQYGDGVLCSTETAFHSDIEGREDVYCISLTKHPLYSSCKVIRWAENGEISTLPTETCTTAEWDNMYLCKYDVFSSTIEIIEENDKSIYLNIVKDEEFDTVSFSLKQWSVGIGQGYLVLFVSPDRKYENGYYCLGYNVNDKKWYKMLFPNQPYYIDTTGINLLTYQLEDNEWTQANPQRFFFGDSENSSYFICNMFSYDVCAIESVSTSPEYNFPSGYLCMAHKLPVGENIDTNTQKLTLDSYLIAPIGNGGYFDIGWNYQSLEASYYANQLNNFTNQLSVNLALNCRYINPDLEHFKVQQTSVNIPNWLITTSKQEPYLTDKYNNIWTGQESLVSRPHFNGELVFLDIEYDTYSTAENNKKVYYFNATTKQPISLQPQLWLY